MKVYYNKTSGIGLLFQPNEFQAAITILDVIYKVTGLEVIKESIEAIKVEFQPKQVPFVNHFHFCAKCFCELDDRTDNVLQVTVDGDTNFVHSICPTLKQNRPE